MAARMDIHNQPKPTKKPSLLGDMLVHILLGSIIILALAAVTLIVLPPNLIRAAGIQPPAAQDPEISLDASPAIVELTTYITSTSDSGAGSTNPQANPTQQTARLADYILYPPIVGQGGDCINGDIMDIYENHVWFKGWKINLSKEATPNIVYGTAIAQDNGVFHFPPPPLEKGTYILSLEIQSGWQQVTSSMFKVTLNGEKGNCAQVRFKLEALACLNIFKEYAVNGIGLAGWDFTAEPVAPTKGSTQYATSDGLGWAHFINLVPGNWSITEADKVGWRLVRIEPDGTNKISLISPRTPGVCQEMTFVNEQVGDSCICAQKVDPSGKLITTPAWEMTLTRPDGTQQSQTRYTGDDGLGTACFQHLALGVWNVAETTQAPFWEAVGPLDPDKPDNPNQDVPLDQPSNACRLVKFVNQPLGCVDVLKINQLDQPLTGWMINAQNTATGKAKPQPTGSDGRTRFYLAPGTWNFTEESVPGWSPVTPSQLSVNVTHAFEPCEQVIFKNRADVACVDVWKKDYYDQKAGLPDWVINLSPAFGGTTQKGMTDGTGWVRFYDLTPGYYKLSEIMMSGWLPVGVEIVNTDGSKQPLSPLLSGYSTDILNLQATGQCAIITFYNRQTNTPDPGSRPAGSAIPTDNVPTGCASNYTVQRGDYLSEIARRFGVTLQALLAVNHVVNPNLIYPGTVLCIPPDP